VGEVREKVEGQEKFKIVQTTAGDMKRKGKEAEEKVAKLKRRLAVYPVYKLFKHQ
jgi:hypothetical protein